MYGYIYKTTNLVNGKIYIGQKKSKTFLGLDYLGSGKYLWCAIHRYGKDNFIVEFLDSCDTKESLDLLEKYYIKKYNSTDSSIGYNIANGAIGGDTYSNLSDADKIRRNLKRLKSYKENYQRKIAIHKGDKDIKILETDLPLYLQNGWEKGRSEKYQTILNNSHLGIRQSDEWVKKRIASTWENKTKEQIQQLKEKHSEATKRQMSKVPKSRRIEIAKNANKFKGRKCAWVNKDGKSHFIYEEDLQKYLDNGYTKGMVKRGSKQNK